MNNIANLFSIERFLKYATYKWHETKRTYIILSITVFILLFFINFLSIKALYHVGRDMYRNSFALYALYSVSFYIISFYIINNSFKYLGDKSEHIKHLLTPISTFEKFAFEIFTKLILIPLIFAILIYISIHCTVFIVNTFDIYTQQDFIIPPLKEKSFFHLDALKYILSYYSTLTIFIATSTFFKKSKFIKSFLTLFVMYIFIACIAALILSILKPEVLSIPYILRITETSYRIPDIYNNSLDTFTSILMIILCLSITFFRTREETI